MYLCLASCCCRQNHHHHQCENDRLEEAAEFLRQQVSFTKQGREGECSYRTVGIPVTREALIEFGRHPTNWKLLTIGFLNLVGP